MSFFLLKWKLFPQTPLICLGQAALGATLLNLLTVAPQAPAQTISWSNLAGGDWSVGSNWVGSTAPTPGATTALVFGSPATQSEAYTATNDIASPFQLNSLTFNSSAGNVTLAGSGLSFVGADPTLAQSGAGTAIINTPVTLTAATTVAGTGTGAVTFNEAVNGGANNLVKTSAGSLTLARGGSLNVLELTAGTTNITDGTLSLSRADNTATSLVLATAAGQTVVLNQSGGSSTNFTENANIGEAPGSTATVNVIGAGTVLDNTLAGQTGLLRVGHHGTGTLNVTAGGVVNIRNLYIGISADGIGDAIVDGVGSAINSSFMFRVGNRGTGTLTVRNGGSLNAGTVFESFALIVGNTGTGTLTIEDGGTVTSPVAYIGYGGDNGLTGTGTFTVTGTDSAFTVGIPTDAGELGIGMTELGTGTLNVQNGGLVTVNGNAIGAYFDGHGTINVTDPGSVFRVTGRLGLGGEFSDAPGTATLNVGSGGTVTVDGRARLQNASVINLNSGGFLSLGSLADGPRNGNGVINLAAGTTLNLADGTDTFSGIIGGAGSLTKIGTGVQTLAGANSYSGNTTVSSGTLRLTGTGSFAASTRITVGTEAGSAAILDGTGLRGGANFGDGGFTLAPNQTLSGHGSVVGSVTITSESAVAPGSDNIGQLSVAEMIWAGGGRYLFEFNSLTPNAGITNDFIHGTGALHLTATAANPLTVDIRGLSFSSAGTTHAEYTIATFVGGVTGFEPAAFAFPATGWFSDTPTIALQGNNLVLAFTPVPSLAGDYNANGQVEQGDLDLVLLNWGMDGSLPPAGWINNLPEGSIDQEELDDVLLNWGSGATAGIHSPAAVPEPCAAGMLLVVALFAAVVRCLP